jgi:tRNA G18 (ribose-2'-O)-methylase SpoU
LAVADLSVRIPMRGKAESLNVASAGAILMWEIVRGESKLVE